MEEYRSNSQRMKDRAEKKDIQKVTTGKVTVKKKTFGDKIRDSFVEEDGKSISDYIVNDVLVPGIKRGLFDMVTGGLEMLFYGEVKGRRRDNTTRANVNQRASYSSYYGSRQYDSRPQPRVQYEYDDILFDTREDAREVLTSMDDIVEQYGVVTVSDYYDLVGKTARWTDNNYGWTDLRNAQIMSVSGGYTINLPKAMPV